MKRKKPYIVEHLEEQNKVTLDDNPKYKININEYILI